MSIIEALKEYMFSCPLVKETENGINIDFSDGEKKCGIAPTGNNVIEVYINGSEVHQYNAVFYISGCTIDDIVRLENQEFVENVSDWIYQQNINGNLPKLSDKYRAIEISSDNGMLFELSENGRSGLYQLQIHLEYERTNIND